MKITLVHASISGCGFNSFGKGDLTESTWINHGLCSISAYAKSKGFFVDLIDLRKLKSWEDFEKEILVRKPDIMGLSMMSVDYNYVMKCIEIIKDIDKDIKIVAGGPHPTLMTEEVSSNPKIDYIILGEGEISFTNLLENLQAGKSQSPMIIQGIKPELDKLPFIDRDLYGSQEYPVVEWFPDPFVTIITSRGCIHNCSFCQPSEKIIFGKEVRHRSVDNIIEELKMLRTKYNFRSLMIHDDYFTENKEFISEFCDKYKENSFSQPFICQTRADFICKNERLLEKMREAGLKMFIVGFESGNQRILNFLRKGTTVEQNYEAAKICKRIGIKIWANYMLGMPTETRKEVMDTVRMIKKIKPDHHSPAFYTPHPGSDLFDWCKKNSLSLINSHDDYRRNPYGIKIKGIDYNFLNKALTESLGNTGAGRKLGVILEMPRVRYMIKLLKKIKLGEIAVRFVKRKLINE